jgi:hypothetical protein
MVKINIINTFMEKNRRSETILDIFSSDLTSK